MKNRAVAKAQKNEGSIASSRLSANFLLYLRCFIYPLLLCLPYGIACAQEFRNVSIPAAWIEKVIRYDYTGDNGPLINDFAKLIAPDSVIEVRGDGVAQAGIFTPLVVNLDEDAQSEIVALIGWSDTDLALAVLKQRADGWALVYLEHFREFYSPPELNVANVPSPNKTFYIRVLNDRGSGIFKDSYQFYKLIGGKVYRCLTLIQDAHIYGWGLFLNQYAKSSFRFSASLTDEISVTYEYSFFPGPVFEHDQPWEGHDEVSFVKGTTGASYHWNNQARAYMLTSSSIPGALTEEKIRCLGQFGDDAGFIKAFDSEIHETLKSGTAIQKRVLNAYLALPKAKAPVAASANLKK